MSKFESAVIGFMVGTAFMMLNFTNLADIVLDTKFANFCLEKGLDYQGCKGLSEQTVITAKRFSDDQR